MGKFAVSVELELDKTRTLQLTANELIAYRKAAGEDLWDTLGKDASPLAMMRAIIWANLLVEDPDITVTEAGKLIHFGNMAQVTDKLTALYADNVPEGEGDGDPAPFDGSPSGPQEESS